MKILLTGKARSGKGEAAMVLQSQGFTELQFSGILKEAVRKLNPIVDYKLVQNDAYATKFEPIRFNDIVDKVGMEKAKEHPEVRRSLQRMGTEVGRELFGKDFWVDQTMNRASKLMQIGHEDFVLSDGRFDNEAWACNYIIEIVRPSDNKLGENATHASELGVSSDLVDFTIVNDGTLEEFKEKVQNVLREIQTRNRQA